jgi:hypothetical protein
VDEDNINLICDIALYHECSILGPHCTSFLLSHLEAISVTPSFGYLNDKGMLILFDISWSYYTYFNPKK